MTTSSSTTAPDQARPSPGRGHVDLLFLFRELVKRDFQARYAGSALGLIWSLVQPLWQLVLFTFVFSAVLKFRLPEGEPIASFPVFLFAALIPWSAFQEGVSRSTTAITDNASLVKKLSFPPELLILSAIAGGLVQSAISAAIFVVYLAVAGDLSLSTLPWLLLALPLQIALTLGIGLLLAALQVFLRDVVQVVGVGMTTWFYLTPIVYPFSLVPEWLKIWLSLNPLTGLVGLYRLAFVGGHFDDWLAVGLLAALAVVALVVGRLVFQSLRPGFADEI